MPSAAKKTVELFYDVISPYAWVGFEVLCRYQQKWGLHVKFRPVLVGGVFKNTDNDAPGLHPVKLAYSRRDILRLASYYDIPFSEDYVRTFDPKTTPFFQGKNLSSQRLLVATEALQPEFTKPLSSELFKRHWSTDKDLTKPESLVEAVIHAGLSSTEAQNLVGKIEDPTVKQQLLENSKHLSDTGGFGVPCMSTQDEHGETHVLFGSDRFHILAHLLGEQYEGPLKELSTCR